MSLVNDLKRVLSHILPERGISKNAWIYSLGVYSSKVISLIIFPIIVIELGLLDTGKYDLVISTVIILAPIFSLQVSDAAYRWLTDPDQKQKQIGVTISAALMAIMAVILSLVTLVTYLLYSEVLILLGSLILFSQIVLFTMMQIVRGNGQIKLYTTATIVRSVTFAVGELWAVFYTENKLENVLAAFVVSNIAGLIVCFWKGFKKEQFSRDALKLEHFKSVLKYIYPLVFNALSWLLLINANKYIITANLGYEMNGVFAIAEKLATPIYFLGLFYFFSAQDHFLTKNSLKDHRVAYQKLLRKVGFITILGIVALLIGVYLLLPTLFPDLVPGMEYLPWFAFANLVMIMGIYLGIPYTYEKKSLSLAFTTISGVLCTVILSFFLIKPFGLMGICISILIGAILILSLRVRHMRLFFKTVSPD